MYWLYCSLTDHVLTLLSSYGSCTDFTVLLRILYWLYSPLTDPVLTLLSKVLLRILYWLYCPRTDPVLTLLSSYGSCTDFTVLLRILYWLYCFLTGSLVTVEYTARYYLDQTAGMCRLICVPNVRIWRKELSHLSPICYESRKYMICKEKKDLRRLIWAFVVRLLQNHWILQNVSSSSEQSSIFTVLTRHGL